MSSSYNSFSNVLTQYLALLWVPFSQNARPIFRKLYGSNPGLLTTVHSQGKSFSAAKISSGNEIVYTIFQRTFSAFQLPETQSRTNPALDMIDFIMNPISVINMPQEQAIEKDIMNILRTLRPIFFALTNQVVKSTAQPQNESNPPEEFPFPPSVFELASEITLELLDSNIFLTSMYAMISSLSKSKIYQFEAARLFGMLLVVLHYYVTVESTKLDSSASTSALERAKEVIRRIANAKVLDISPELAEKLKKLSHAEAETDIIDVVDVIEDGDDQVLHVQTTSPMMTQIINDLDQTPTISMLDLVTNILKSSAGWAEGKLEASRAQTAFNFFLQ